MSEPTPEQVEEIARAIDPGAFGERIYPRTMEFREKAIRLARAALALSPTERLNRLIEIVREALGDGWYADHDGWDEVRALLAAIPDPASTPPGDVPRMKPGWSYR